jgi:hypothetical protein
LYSSHQRTHGLSCAGALEQGSASSHESESCIRNAVIALGALFSSHHGLSENEIGRLRREFAYREYGLAINDARRMSTDGKTDARTKLIVCLLFAAFEAYHENHMGVAAQVLAGNAI